MESKHATLYEYQYDWAEAAALNTSAFIRMKLSEIIPEPTGGTVAEGETKNGISRDEVPGLADSRGLQPGFATKRMHLSLEPYQKEWVNNTKEFRFSVFCQACLDARIPESTIPDRREVISVPEQLTTIS